MTDFTPQLHPQHEAILRGEITPPKTGEDAVTLNDRLGLWVTRHVGTMWCAYLFALIALISLPTVLKQAGFPIGFDFGGGTVILITNDIDEGVRSAAVQAITNLLDSAGGIRNFAEEAEPRAIIQAAVENHVSV